MKNLIYLSIFTILLFVSCTKDRNEDIVFDKSSQERLEDKFTEYNDLLKSSEYGWKMKYYPDVEKFGGYNFLFKFDENNRVVMVSDFEENPKNSSYRIYGGQGVVLSFDTYNMIHILADPGIYSAGEGYNGDYEMVVERATTDSLICKGRKWKKPMIFTRATSEDWDNMEKIKIHEKAMSLGHVENTPLFRNLREDNQGISTFIYNSSTRMVEYFYIDNIGITHSYKSPVVFTKEGFSLKEKITINGKSFQDFTYDEDSEKFVFGTNGTVSAEHFSCIEFLGAWEAFTSGTGATISAAGKDFFSLYRRLRIAEPEFTTIQLYWNISGYKLLSFVFGNGEGVDGYHWWHSWIRIIEETSEDTVILKAAINGETGGRYIFENPNYEEEYQRLFVDFNESSQVIDEIMDVYYNKAGLTIIPTSDEGVYYVVSKEKSNYWVKFKIF
jgi:hypothetical protein